VPKCENFDLMFFTEADIGHFLRMLSVGKKKFTHAECALKNMLLAEYVFKNVYAC
jgi:hypothetical protein